MMISYTTSIAQNWLRLRIFDVAVSCCRGHTLDYTDVKKYSARQDLQNYKKGKNFLGTNLLAALLCPALGLLKLESCFWRSFSFACKWLWRWWWLNSIFPPVKNTKNMMMMTMIMIVHSFFPLHAGGHSRSLGLVRFNRRRKNIFVRHVRPDNVLRMGCTIYLGTDLWFIWKRPSGFKYKSIEDKENSQRHLKILTSAWSF